MDLHSDARSRKKWSKRHGYTAESAKGPITAFGALVLLSLLLLSSIQAASATTTVRVLVPVFYNQEATQPLLQAFFNQSGIQVEFISMNTDITEHTATAVQNVFSNKDSYIDLLALDVVWTGDYGEHLLPLDGDTGLASALALHNPQNVAAGLVNGKLVAIPQSAEYGLLYYRADILQRHGFSDPPTTFDKMEEMMAKIVPEERKTNPAFVGLINQVKEPYEGLTCNVLEMLYAEEAGIILEPNRTLSTFDQASSTGQRAINVAKRWRRWHSTGYFPLGYAEQSSAREWARGNALFMRNWPFATAVTRNAGVTWPWRLTKLPGAAATLGGWLWGASKYTRQPEASKRVLELFAGQGWQKAKALSEGTPPTIPALYNDVDVCAAIPMCSVVSQLKVARRPSGAAGVHYAGVSKIIATYWFDILRGFGGSVESLLDKMNRDIAHLLNIDVLGDPTNVSPSSAAVAAFNAIASIEILLLLASLTCFVLWRKTPVVVGIGLGFLGPVTVGTALQLVLVYLTAGIPSTSVCIARYWVQGLGFAFTLGACSIHLFRIWTLASNPFVKQRRVPLRQIVLNLGPAVIGILGILIGFSASRSIAANEVTLSRSRYIGCISANPIVKTTVNAIWYSSYGVQLLPAIYYGYRASVIGNHHGVPEARLLTLCLANAGFLALVLIPFVDLDLVDQSTGYILRSLVLTVSIGVFLGLYLLPRVWLAFQHWRNPAQATILEGMPSVGSSTAGGALNTMHMTQTKEAAAATNHPTIQASSVVSTQIGAPNAGLAAGDSAAAHATKMLQAPQLKRFSFGCEGVLTMRLAQYPWLLHFAPWKLVHGFLLPKEKVLVLQAFDHTSTSHAKCIPLNQISQAQSIADGGNEFEVALASGKLIRFMAADAADAKSWITEIGLVM